LFASFGIDFHLFIFLIRDTRAEGVLFIGRLMKPR
jgi:serine protease inhibitor